MILARKPKDTMRIATTTTTTEMPTHAVSLSILMASRGGLSIASNHLLYHGSLRLFEGLLVPHPYPHISYMLCRLGHTSLDGRWNTPPQPTLSRPRAARGGAWPFHNPRISESPFATLLGVRMDMVYPVHLLRRLGSRNIEINNYRLLVIAHDDTGKWFVLARINLLMGNERWHVDEVARPSFGNEFKALSPPHPRPATYHVDHAL